MVSSLCRAWQHTTFMLFGAKPMSLRAMRQRLRLLVSCPDAVPWPLFELAHWQSHYPTAAIHPRYVVGSPHIVVSLRYLFRRGRPQA